jgi:hypothetical protein
VIDLPEGFRFVPTQEASVAFIYRGDMPVLLVNKKTGLVTAWTGSTRLPVISTDLELQEFIVHYLAVLRVTGKLEERGP